MKIGLVGFLGCGRATVADAPAGLTIEPGEPSAGPPTILTNLMTSAWAQVLTQAPLTPIDHGRDV